ncbi:protein rtoA-like [Ptychodera flava]|uniref:protein rtoA-like n=1 Tax=Ptychodera flava TaxID=63121 RepID=UPI00396A5E31
MSKYDTEKFVNPPDVELVCCICQGVLDMPVETPCRHVFCKTCIETWLNTNSSCPTCRKRFTGRAKLQPVLPIVANMINKMLMKCDYAEHGCSEGIQLEHHALHVKHCEFEPIDCWNAGCDKKILRRERYEHEKECMYSSVRCENGCGCIIIKKDAPTHDCIKLLSEKLKASEDENRTLRENLKSQEELQHRVNALERYILKKKLGSRAEVSEYTARWVSSEGASGSNGFAVMNSEETVRQTGSPAHISEHTDANIGEVVYPSENTHVPSSASSGSDASVISDSDSEDYRSVTLAQEDFDAQSGHASDHVSLNQTDAASSDSDESHNDSNSDAEHDPSEGALILSSDENDGEDIVVSGNSGGEGSDNDREPSVEANYDSTSDASWVRSPHDRSSDVTISVEVSEDEYFEPEGVVSYTDALNAYRSSETDHSWTPGQEGESEGEGRQHSRRRRHSDSDTSGTHRRRKRRRRYVSTSSSESTSTSSSSSGSCADSDADSISVTGSYNSISSDTSED